VHNLLDPTFDVVFKLLFTRGPKSDVALRGLLTAVLAPAEPIVAVRVRNPRLPVAEVDEKGSILDLLVELADGTKIDLEMQVRGVKGFRERALWYWAKLFGGQLVRGGDHAKLRPAISILFLGYRELEGNRLHSVFHILDAHDHKRLTDAFEMHIIELPKLQGPAGGLDPDHASDADIALLHWSRFFAAKTDEALKAAAMSDPAIQQAHDVLEELSADPEVRLLVQHREQSQQAYRLAISAALDEGVEKGVEKGLRIGVLDLCEVLGITPTEEQRAQLEQLDAHALEALRTRLKKDRRWT
jgi:predicted transposase/invertase (TIGR01784 family)